MTLSVTTISPDAVTLIAGLYGLMAGSFLSVVIGRAMDSEHRFWKGRSRCPRCSEIIPAWCNVPVVSFALLAGRSRCCRKPIGWRYPFLEIGCALLCMVWMATAPNMVLGIMGALANLCLVAIVGIVAKRLWAAGGHDKRAA